MANEITVSGLNAGQAYFARITNSAGLTWTGSGNNFAAASTITWATAGIPLTPDGTITTDFTASFPAAITTAGKYKVTAHEQAGASPALSDVLAGEVAKGTIDWTGTAEASIQAVQGRVLKALPDRQAADGPIVTSGPAANQLDLSTAGKITADLEGSVDEVAQPVPLPPAPAGYGGTNTTVVVQRE